MEMEQWDDGNANDDNSYQQNNVNSIESYGDNNNNSYHQNDDQYNQYNDYNQYDNNNNNNNHNNNNNNYNSNRYMSHRNNDNYRTNNYRRNNQYNQYNRNNQYNKYNNNNYRGRGGYNKNRYNNNNSRYGGGYNNNYRQRGRGRGRGRGRERGRGRGRYNDRNRHYNNNDNYYQQKRPQYQPKSQHEVKNTNDNNMQSDFNENNQINQDNDYNQNNEITQYNNTSNTSNTSNANDDYRAPSSSSRPSSRDHRFGGKKKKKGRRIIEDNLDFEVNEEEDDEEEDNNEESNTNEQSRDYNNDYNNNNYNNDDNNYNDYNDNNKRKTRYVDDADAQLYERNRFASNNNNNFNNKRYNNQQSFSSRKMGQRRQNTLELENLSGRAKEMALQLKSGKYDCMICQSLIGKKGRIWHCGHCYTMFHITCINKWARAREDKDAETEQRAPKPDYLITKIRCPACNFVDENFKFNQYKCFCGKVIFDHDYRSSYNFASTIPHSCGDICGKKRGADCPHTCPAECHPGPCQPCKLPSTRKSSCPCGKLKYSLLCGQVEKQPRLCQQICNKLLKCGNHRCKDKCHHGECKPCEITMEQECFCGKHKKKAKCGTGIKVKVKVLKNNDEEKKEREEFVWKYSCNKKCDKLLSCKNHRCTLICHNGSCSNCPRKIETPTICACRKTTFKDIIRTSCSDPLPICDKKCGRMLGCGKHFCKKQCHDSKCQLCMLQVKKRCRCGASEKKFKCHDYHKRLKKYLENNETAIFLGQQDYWIKCGKKCKRVKSCGKHICSEICCPGRNNRTYFEGHQCREVCNKLLECGRHRCSSYCHRGRCNPCGVTYRNGVECACGSVFVPGPFQCGTRDIPICNQTCDKVLPCGHLCAAKCHHGDCPPCNRLCSKECPHGILVHNLPCKIEHRSCGNPCGLILSCGIHKCNRSCHFGPCQKESNNNKGCGQICGLELKCGHKCLSKCHAGNCNANSCKAQITVKCKCGNTSEKQYCRGRTEYELKAVPCTENCQIAERNKRFAEALNIDTRKKTNSKSGHGDGNNETNSEQKEQTKKIRIPFAASVLRRILKWMNDDKSHTTIIKQDKKILSPKFVYYIEGILSAYISDDSQDLNKFKVQYPDITTLISSKSDPIINLKPMNSEQRFIVYSLVTNYLLRYERKENSGKHGSSYLEISKTKHCRIPNELLSNALIEYQIRGNEIETLESMPPSSIIVIDDSTDISSSVIQDRLLAWTGDYRMWRNENNQLFIVFTDQNARNSAMTEMRKFNGRKATQSDSLSAASSHKKNQQKKKKLKSQQQKDSQQQQQKSRNSGSANSGWSTKGDQLKFTVNNMAKIKPKKLNIKTNNRFG